VFPLRKCPAADNNYMRSFRWQKQKRRMLLLLSAIVVVYFFLPWLLNATARSLIREDPLVAADLIISLSGDSYCQRERQAVALYQQGRAPRVLVSGYAYGPDQDTSTAASAYVRSLGLPENVVIALPGGNNTRLEAEHIATLMRARGWRSAILVTSAFHSRRAFFTFARTAPDLTFSSAPVPARAPEWEPEKWWTRRGDLGTTVREFFAWGNTVVTGWK
jgi:uncharacterized SAM-binding protein YcdF (DUF218 family)